ncbi:glutamate--cysteine ligase [Acidihalobacter ferrooxydans]|uniref:Glutamate--cysteine ligase n=1 Tax=Acidihalobacter ferrooxydans TaxID=1765967 RepID=A0A1P8UKC4_9GAMM|nr:glutamate--cysteine ligase [Acidihalobacter ferrooxydans]APZ44289.1 glutamate--cysteine ligase [Acidihalobacter ferrooxydans]
MSVTYSSASEHLARFLAHGNAQHLRSNLIGLEKETLRVLADGSIARTRHPRVLGSALTNPYVTTDYSEALLELITPPSSGEQALAFLDDVHRFVYQGLDNEYLWATSMPCVLSGESSIPIAEYGPSNPGRMKHIYRVGLGHRYGRVMQVIAGVHFNFSISDLAWQTLHALAGEPGTVQDFISARYMGLVRNIQRVGWLVPYLFGASPAVCESFFVGRSSNLPRFDEHTLYEPYATSLRMGDIGYTNAKEGESGIKASYDSLASYVESLECAIGTPSERYARIGVKVDGEYRQLNDHILQIENEYYSTIRPKPLLQDDERPTIALRRHGIRYVELRSLDVNAFEPLGLGLAQMRFLETLLLFCLFADSPVISAAERDAIDINFARVAHRGREPGLELEQAGGKRLLREWAHEILDALQPFCDVLDADAGTAYRDALAQQREKVRDPEATPSARMLAEMRARGEGFHAFACRQSLAHRDAFLRRPLAQDRYAFFENIARESLQRQQSLETSDTGDFDAYLAAYFAQRA